jgi:hypothetical protein
MTEKEIGTLAELNVKPGDVVGCVGWTDDDDSNFFVGTQYTIMKKHPKGYYDDLCAVGQDGWERVDKEGAKMLFRIISRASDTERDSKPADVRGDECHTPLADMGFSTVEATVSGVYHDPATPKTWGEMTDEEKGALLLAHHQGKVIEFVNDCDVRDWKKAVPRWADFCSYRVRPPEPKRETVTLSGWWIGAKYFAASTGGRLANDTHRITLPSLDGNIPAGTYTSEAGETIIVEEL